MNVEELKKDESFRIKWDNIRKIYDELELIYWKKYRQNALLDPENLGKYGAILKPEEGGMEQFVISDSASWGSKVNNHPGINCVCFYTIIGQEEKFKSDRAKRKKKSKGRIKYPSNGFLSKCKARMSYNLGPSAIDGEKIFDSKATCPEIHTPGVTLGFNSVGNPSVQVNSITIPYSNEGQQMVFTVNGPFDS